MQVRIIKNDGEYHEALKRFQSLFLAEKGTQESDEADLLALVIEKYESENHEIEEPDPIEYIKYKMKKMGLKPKDLVPAFGSFSRVSEVFAGKRKLTVKMIKNIHRMMLIPYDILLRNV